MSRRDPDEGVFLDASVYFSEEDWKLLQEWQKELYRKVMKEIHHALISLGPLIATTVCTLRAKEKEERRPMDNPSSERNRRINNSPSDTVAGPDTLLKINTEAPLPGNGPRDFEGSESNASLSTDISPRKDDEPGSIFIDHLGAEIGEGSTEDNSGYEIVSFRIPDEDESYCIDEQNTMRLKRSRSPSGEERMDTKVQVGDSMKSLEMIPMRKAFLGNIKSVVHQSSNKETASKKQMTSLCHQELKGEKTAECKGSFRSQVNFNVPPGSALLFGPNKYNEVESFVLNSQFPLDMPDPPQKQTAYPFAQNDKSYCPKGEFTTNVGNNSRARPFACIECEKSFFDKSQLLAHRKTHLGEKPFVCTFCHKGFLRKDYLGEHIRTHTGERPYKCTKCEKRFVQKSHLNEHKKKHICIKIEEQ